MELVDVVPGSFAYFPVDSDAVPDLILNNQHTDFLELLAQLLDVVADHPIAHVHIGLMVEHIQRAGDIDFQGSGNKLRFLFLLPAQTVIQITKDGHILRLGVIEIILIHHPHTAVNDGFLHRLQSVLTAHNQLTQGENEVRFQRKRVFLVAVIEVDVHGVDVVLGGRRNFDDLSLQTLH